LAISVNIYFFFQAEDGIRDRTVPGVQTCALPISMRGRAVGGLRRALLDPGFAATTFPIVIEAVGIDDAIALLPQEPATLRSAFEDRKSTPLNSSHRTISYADLCVEKK